MVKPVSIAFVRQRYAQDGGAERFVSRALEALRSRNMSLSLITREWRGGEGFDVISCNPFYLGRLWRDWSFARAVCRELRKRSFDLVQSHERIACCNIYRAGDGVHREWLRQLARVRGPLGRLGTVLNPYHHYVKSAEKRMFTNPRLKAVICNSKMVRDEIKRYFGLPDEKLHVIYSGVDTEAFHPRLKRHRVEIRARYGIPQDAALFLFVGSGFERKGLAVLLQALAMIPPGAWLLVVGRDKRLARYERLARTLGIDGHTRFLGSQLDVKPYYGAADALVLPTLYDPFPNVALEAMASGLPVITSLTCGAAELITPGVNGYVCDATDAGALAERMAALVSCDDRERWRQAARATVEPFTLEAMSRALNDVYQSTISRLS
jgi:UDP-glucose:(heptosyl)LPS alpha-1,3-glucosyltransferase